MPAYEYELLNGQTVVAKLTIPLPISERDSLRVRRNPVPEMIAVSGAAPDPDDQATQVLTACRRAEYRQGNNREFRKRLGFSPKTYLRAWSK